MKYFIIRIAINAITLWFTVILVPGINITFQNETNPTNTILGYGLLGLTFGIINILIKPIIKIIAIPITILTLGFFALVINAAMLWLTSEISQNTFVHLTINNFWWTAIWGSIIITLVSSVLNSKILNK